MVELIFGPPGCGKTTEVIRRVRAHLTEDGYAPEQVMVCSFSRAAFREFRSRLADLAAEGLEIPDENLGTLHSLGYRMLGRPGIALETKPLAEWNKGAGLRWAISPRLKGQGRDTSDPYADGGGLEPGDELFDRVTLLRNRMVPVAQWGRQEREFHHAWEAWKVDQGLVDFADMVEQPLKEVMSPPERVRVAYVDEAQDLSPLQHALVMWWSRFLDLTVLVGDDDQALYAFQGADASVFLSTAADRRTVLSQSYRVPAAVQRAAMNVAAQIHRREPKVYQPRPEEGRVRFVPSSPGDPYWAVDEGVRFIQQGKSVMYLAPARYMLAPLIRELKERALPFWNPYALHRPEFNPFGPPPNPGQTASWQRAAAFAQGARSGKGMRAWVKHLRVAGVFEGGAASRAYFERLSDDEEVGPDHPVWEWLTLEAREAAEARDLDWYEAHLMASGRGQLYPLAVIRRHGLEALYEEPRITVGTIHSVKGGESDVVFVFPTLSARALEEAAERGWDDLHRLFYVAFTRARGELVLLEHDPAFGPEAYPWPDLRDSATETVVEEEENDVITI